MSLVLTLALSTRAISPPSFHRRPPDAISRPSDDRSPSEPPGTCCWIKRLAELPCPIRWSDLLSQRAGYPDVLPRSSNSGTQAGCPRPSLQGVDRGDKQATRWRRMDRVASSPPELRRKPSSGRRSVGGVTRRTSRAPLDRVIERRRAVAPARHYREFEGLSIAQIADRLASHVRHSDLAQGRLTDRRSPGTSQGACESRYARTKGLDIRPPFMETSTSARVATVRLVEYARRCRGRRDAGTCWAGDRASRRAPCLPHSEVLNRRVEDGPFPPPVGEDMRAEDAKAPLERGLLVCGVDRRVTCTARRRRVGTGRRA